MIARRTLVDETATELRALIAADFGPGQQLPSEADLAAIIGVSRTTLRAAISALWTEGLLVRRWGVGTFVRDASDPVTTSLTEVTPTRDIIRSSGHEPSITHAEIEQVPCPEAAAIDMGIAAGTPVWSVVRIFAADGVPVSHQADFLVLTIRGRAVDPTPLATIENDMVGLLRMALGASSIRYESRVEAVAASGEVASELAVKDGFPLVRMVQSTHAADGTVIQLGHDYVRTDILQLRLTRLA